MLIMKTVFDKDRATLRRKLSEIFRELRPFSEVPMYEKLICQFWYYAITNARKLMDTDVKEIETKIHETKGEKTMPTLVQTWIKRGRKEGRIEGKIESILRTLTKRFHVVSWAIKDRIFTITDLERLEELADFAFDCQTLEEFEEQVNRYGS